MILSTSCLDTAWKVFFSDPPKKTVNKAVNKNATLNRVRSRLKKDGGRETFRAWKWGKTGEVRWDFFYFQGIQPKGRRRRGWDLLKISEQGGKRGREGGGRVLINLAKKIGKITAKDMGEEREGRVQIWGTGYAEQKWCFWGTSHACQ